MGYNEGDTPESIVVTPSVNLEEESRNCFMILAFIQPDDPDYISYCKNIQNLVKNNVKAIGVLYKYGNGKIIDNLDFQSYTNELINEGISFKLVNNGLWDGSAAQNYKIPDNESTQWVCIISKSYVIAAKKTTINDITNVIDNLLVSFTQVFKDTKHGIASFDLARPEDRAFAFDYEGTGKLDHIVFYRPGFKTIHIVNPRTKTSPVSIGENDSANGIGSFDLARPADRAFAFDYEGTGKLDHIVFYRPGFKTIHIVNPRTKTSPVSIGENDSAKGIGSFDLARPVDRAFAFDYEGTGKLDHIVFYRPGYKTIHIVNPKTGTSPVSIGENDSAKGIGTFDLARPVDRAFAFDYEGTGKLDHIVFYRPGYKTIHIVNPKTGISPVSIGENDSAKGIGSFDLARPEDRAFAFDYEGIGKLNYIVFYRPGYKTIHVINPSTQTSPIHIGENSDADGIGGYNLGSPDDRMFSLDYNGSGMIDHLVLYRPGTGTICIIKQSS